jgi:hypothetical protein
VTSVLMSDCVGSWRRTLLVNPDGSRDTTTDVRWLQGITVFVDSRGFGGWLNQRADVFEWSHFVNVQASEAHPDAAVMRWDDDTLIETGVYADYVEHWERDLSAAASPCWALTLCSAEGNDALLLRAGDQFGWMRRDTRVEVSLGRIDGADWVITDSALPRRMGRSLRPTLHAQYLDVNDVDDDGTPTLRRWRIKDSEGSVKL